MHDELLDEFTPEEIETARDVRRRINERLAAGERTGRTGAVVRDSIIECTGRTGAVVRDSIVERTGCTGAVVRDSIIERTGRTGAVVRDSVIERNRENAQSSTGPRTEEGKARSSRNAVRHGLSGAFCVHHSESEEEFLHLRTSLLAEHLPATPTEILLVENMARHEWLTQRALRMQENLIAPDQWSKDFNRDLALYLRYQTTHQRAFHKCLADLQKAQKLRKQNELAESGFVSQKPKSTPAKTTAATPQSGFVSQNQGSSVAQTVVPSALPTPERSKN